MPYALDRHPFARVAATAQSRRRRARVLVRGSGGGRGADGQDGLRRTEDQSLSARDHGQRGRGSRLRRRRLARRVRRQRHDAGRLSQRSGADQPSVSQPSQRVVRGRDGQGGPGPHRLGAGGLRRRLRQRRRRRPLRDVLGPEPALSQPRQRSVRRGRARGGPGQRGRAMGRRVRFPGFRPRRPSRSVCRQLHRLQPDDAPVPESGLCRYKGVPVACGPPGLRGGKNLLYRNAGDGTFADVSDAAGITQGQRDIRPGRQHAGLRRRRVGGCVRRERFEPERALPEQSRRHLHRYRRGIGLRVQPGRQAAGGDGRGDGRLQSRRPDGHLQDQLRRRHLNALRECAAAACARIARSRRGSA